MARPAATLAVFAFTALGACRDATSPQQQAAGAYTLRSVGGQPLPVVVRQDDSGTTAIASDALTLGSDGTVTEQATLHVTSTSGGAPTTQTQSNTGTWTLSGSTVTATLDGGPRLSGQFSAGNTLTIAATTTGGANATLVYQK